MQSNSLHTTTLTNRRKYCNSFIFDPLTTRVDVYEAGFNARFIKELVISFSLNNRSTYSLTHHSAIGMILYTNADPREEAYQTYLHLHEFQNHADVYTDDEDFKELRRVLHEHNLNDPRLKNLTSNK